MKRSWTCLRIGPREFMPVKFRPHHRGPSGVERNVVITSWEVADLYAHPHDISATGSADAHEQREWSRLLG